MYRPEAVGNYVWFHIMTTSVALRLHGHGIARLPTALVLGYGYRFSTAPGMEELVYRGVIGIVALFAHDHEAVDLDGDERELDRARPGASTGSRGPARFSPFVHLQFATTLKPSAYRSLLGLAALRLPGRGTGSYNAFSPRERDAAATLPIRTLGRSVEINPPRR